VKSSTSSTIGPIEMEVGSNLLQEIQKGQVEDEKIQEIKCNIKEEKSPGFLEDEEGVLWYKGRICVPSIKELKDKILREAHESTYSIHPGGNKMYHNLKVTYWWYGMKRDVAEYVALCDTCQQVKAEHQQPAGLLQHCKFLSGSGKRLPWISSWDCQGLNQDTIPFG
jgi:hypothetical protein